jgi:hypothetical protein
LTLPRPPGVNDAAFVHDAGDTAPRMKAVAVIGRAGRTCDNARGERRSVTASYQSLLQVALGTG